MLKFFILCLIIGAINCFPPLSRPFKPRVVGGTDAYDGEVPYIVSLRNSRGSHMCGGSILNDEWVR